jgi:hypothetical protein
MRAIIGSPTTVSITVTLVGLVILPRFGSIARVSLAEPVDICGIDVEVVTGGREDFQVGKAGTVGVTRVDRQNLERGTDRNELGGVRGG